MEGTALDAVSWLHASALPLPFAGLVTIVLVVLSLYLVNADHEKPATFAVPLPDLALGPVLDPPSLRARKSTAIQCYAPATGRLLGRVNPTTAEGIDRAVEKAAIAQQHWASTTTFSDRRRVLKTLLKFILEHQEDIVHVACLDSGKPRIDAALGEVLVTVEKLQWTIKHGEKALKSEKRPGNLLMLYKNNEVRWEPMGVIAALVSWNYPFHNLLNPIVSSIFAGNALILKPSEATAWSARYFVSIAQGALMACGYSPALIQLVPCWPDTANHLTSHPGISHITFIGSRPVAHHVANSAAKSLTPCCLELGGKDPAVVLGDLSQPKLQQVSSILTRGVFQSAGQNCIGIERVIATSKAYDRLIEIILPRVQALRIGSALDEEEEVDVGAMISATSFDRLEKLIEDAVAKGARLLHGGKRYHHPVHTQGHYFTPTLIIDVTPNMRIAQEELFAPIFLLMRATSCEHALELANSTQYALGASVFGRSTTDLESITRGLKAGMVSVNDFAAYYMCSLPFGGVAGSGYGRFGGEEGLRSICNLKSVQKDATWARWLGVGTSIPPMLDYGSGKGKTKAKGWEFVKGVILLGYGGFAEKITAVGKLIRNG